MKQKCLRKKKNILQCWCLSLRSWLRSTTMLPHRNHKSRTTETTESYDCRSVTKFFVWGTLRYVWQQSFSRTKYKHSVAMSIYAMRWLHIVCSSLKEEKTKYTHKCFNYFFFVCICIFIYYTIVYINIRRVHNSVTLIIMIITIIINVSMCARVYMRYNSRQSTARSSLAHISRACVCLRCIREIRLNQNNAMVLLFYSRRRRRHRHRRHNVNFIMYVFVRCSRCV